MDAVVAGEGVAAQRPWLWLFVAGGAPCLRPFGHVFGGGHGEVAVDVEAFAFVVGVQRRCGGAQIEQGVADGLELGGGAGEEAFVGVQVGEVVPTETCEAEVAAEEEDEDEEEKIEGRDACGGHGGYRLLVIGYSLLGITLARITNNQ